MKILVISHYNSYVSSRPEAEVFLQLKKKGFHIDVVCEPESRLSEIFKENGMGVFHFHPQTKNDKSSQKKIRELLIKGEYDFLHLFNSKATLNGLAASKGLDVKIILYRGYTGNIHWYDPTIYFKFLNPRVDAIWCNSQSIKELFCKQPTFKCQKAYAINKGHLPEWYASTPSIDIRKELNLPEDAFIAVCVANARKMKGMKYLTDSANHLPKNLPIHYIYIGGGLDTPEVKEIIAKSDYKNNFHFLGYREDALSIVKDADIFTLASITGESITKALIEAMSLGCAPVATDISGNKELLIHEKTGIVVKKENAASMAEGILRMYEDKDLRNSISENAKKHIAENIHSTNTVRKLIEMYAELKPSLSL